MGYREQKLFCAKESRWWQEGAVQCTHASGSQRVLEENDVQLGIEANHSERVVMVWGQSCSIKETATVSVQDF